AFNPTLSQAPSTFSPVTTPVDNTAANAINSAAGLLQNFGKIKSDADEAALEQASSSAAAGLFSDTLRTEAEIIEGQDKLTQNQQRFDQLYADGVISADEQKELQQLQKDRARLEGVTNRRQRQVQLRMKYANFVNRFPHLTKEARIMFGDADTRLEEVAQGAQGLVDQEAFETIYGKDSYSAENITNFRNLQKYKAQREIGAVYGQGNFNDWSRNFQADVTTEMFSIGQRMQALFRKQGALRQEDIDTFNSSIQEGYMQGVQQIDQAVLELQKNGQYVDQEQINQSKADLIELRDNMLKMSEEKDFTTRLKNLNSYMEEALKANMNLELGAMTSLIAGTGGGGAKGSADLITLQQLMRNDEGVRAATSMNNIYGAQVRALQESAASTIKFLDEYDTRASAEFFSPALTRSLAQIQGQRIDNGITTEVPEAVKTWIDLAEQGGSSDEVMEGMLSRAKVINQAAIKNNEVKARLSSSVNNYALETKELLQSVGARVRKTGDRYEAFVTNSTGKFVPYTKGTLKLNNMQDIYSNINALGDMGDFESFISDYKNTLNAEVQETIDTLNIGGMSDAEQAKVIKRLTTMYSLTPEDVEQIKKQLRSTDGPEASGG
ncbi:MAG: hypothetical protein OQK78_12340, partial [Gammaproteobacteria bacterium]|nr:hypothetical protein [Gammaproteobacteria bacterium]